VRVHPLFGVIGQELQSFRAPTGRENRLLRLAGCAPDLRDATRQPVRATMEHLGDSHGLSREEAYALCSVAVDLRIHEVVDAPNWVVGAFLPDDIFAGGGNG